MSGCAVNVTGKGDDAPNCDTAVSFGHLSSFFYREGERRKREEGAKKTHFFLLLLLPLQLNPRITSHPTPPLPPPNHVKLGAASIPAGSTPDCASYVSALQAFCTPQAMPNYDSPSCMATLKSLAAKTANGQAGSINARAMMAACFDFLAAFNTDNAMITDTDAGLGKLRGREYLVTGNGLLKQAGGYFIKWLEV